jgi:hypothetical protein
VRGRRKPAPPAARPGFLVAHQGADIGVLEHIESCTSTDVTLLHVRGGVSGSLEYVIPSTAVVDVRPTAQRASVDDRVTFEPETIVGDGRVILVAQLPDDVRATSEARPSKDH